MYQELSLQFLLQLQLKLTHFILVILPSNKHHYLLLQVDLSMMLPPSTMDFIMHHKQLFLVTLPDYTD